MKRLFLTLILILCCSLSGYVFFKFNDGRDPIPAMVFAVGLMGIVLSFARKTPSK